MKSFTPELKYLMSLLQSAIKGEKTEIPPDDLDWNKFVSLSKEQQVYSVIAPIIDLDNMPSSVAHEFKLYTQNELLRMIAMQSEYAAIAAQLEENEIKFMLLKGSVIRNYYPQQKMRQMSDYDILYDYSKHDELLQLMKKRGYLLKSDGGNSDDFTKAPYYTFEFHHELFKDVYGFCPDFDFVWNNAHKSEDNAFRYNMSAEDLYLHCVAHMYKHYLFGGFGIRFLVDTYLIVKKENSVWNRKYIDDKLEEMKLCDFEKLVCSLSFSLLDGKRLDDFQMDFMENTVLTGIYGNDDLKVDKIYEKFVESHKTNSTIKYFFYRLFPSREQMKNIYIQLKDKPYLLLYFYFKRIFERAFSSRKKFSNEMKAVKKYKNNNSGG